MLGKQMATLFKMASCCFLVPFDFAKISLLQCLKGFQYAGQFNDWDRTPAEKELPDMKSPYNSIFWENPSRLTSSTSWNLTQGSDHLMPSSALSPLRHHKIYFLSQTLTAKRPGQIPVFLWKLLHPRNLVHILLWSLLIAEEARDVFWRFDILLSRNHVGCLVGRTIFMPNYMIVIGGEW